MIEALLVVFTNPTEGRDDDFNDWYSHIHTRDALGFRGSIAQQRFILSKEQVQDFEGGAYWAKYLALYEVFDAERFVQEHIDNALTSRMVVENSIDISRLDDFHYYPLQYRDKAPRTFQTGSVVVEQIKAKSGQELQFRDWYNDRYLPERFRAETIITGALLAYDRHGQLVEYNPAHDHVGIWRLSDDRARSLWRSRTLLECPHIEQASLAVSCWDILTERMTEDAVHFPTSTGLAGEERARARIAAAGTGQRDRGKHLKH
jgi:hypothetical protein